MTGKPMFPFGYGLSYTDFEYAKLQIIPEKINSDENVKISFILKNIGNFQGDEVVQLYIHDIVGSVSRPVKELKRFRRIRLKPGEIQTVSFELKPDDLSMFDKNLKKVVEPGDFKIMIGCSSEDIRLSGTLNVE